MLSIWWSARRAPRVPELASESSRERRARTSANSAPTKKPLTATSAATAAKRSAVTCSVSARACASVHLHVGHTVAPRASRGLVLHGESVEKGEDHHRRPELDRAGRLGSKDELGAYAVLPNERHHAPGGEDGEQVESDRLQRQQERAEGARPSGSSSARSRRSLGAARSKWPGDRDARPSQRRPVDFRGRAWEIDRAGRSTSSTRTSSPSSSPTSLRSAGTRARQPSRTTSSPPSRRRSTRCPTARSASRGGWSSSRLRRYQSPWVRAWIRGRPGLRSRSSGDAQRVLTNPWFPRSAAT